MRRTSGREAARGASPRWPRGILVTGAADSSAPISASGCSAGVTSWSVWTASTYDLWIEERDVAVARAMDRFLEVSGDIRHPEAYARVPGTRTASSICPRARVCVLPARSLGSTST
jgi:hypothetical protein